MNWDRLDKEIEDFNRHRNARIGTAIGYVMLLLSVVCLVWMTS